MNLLEKNTPMSVRIGCDELLIEPFGVWVTIKYYEQEN
jgi:hypothetical protein